jgi:hypothetical protein
MPRISNDSDWERGLRASVRASTAKGWSVREDKGKVRLEVRTDAIRGSVTLTFDWTKGCVGDVVTRSRNIYSLIEEGYGLKDAAQIANNSAPREQVQWEKALTSFQDRKLDTGLKITLKTWNEDYRPYLDFATTSMQAAKPAANANALAQAVLNEWEDRPRSSEKALIALKAFLDFSISNHGLPARSWSISRDQIKELRGRSRPRKELAILEDSEIIQLANEVARIKNGEPWKNYVILASTYGLRREEPWRCIPKRHPKHGLQMWCRYEKISGRHRTQPRWLLPLPPNGAEWGDLAIAMSKDQLRLPNTQPQAWNTLLSKLDFWQHLVEKYKEQGQYLKPGAIRDSYSYRAHQQKRALHHICKAMGHSLITHQKHYVWAREDSIFD